MGNVKFKDIEPLLKVHPDFENILDDRWRHKPTNKQWLGTWFLLWALDTMVSYEKNAVYAVVEKQSEVYEL
jgi:hypothetical protein